RPECRFSVDWSNPVTALLPHLSKMRRLARLMREQAIQEAARGEADAALDDVGALFRMSRHTAEEPIFISLLVARAVEAQGYSVLARVAEERPLDRSQVE